MKRRMNVIQWLAIALIVTASLAYGFVANGWS